MHAYYVIPLLAALVYTIGALCLKRATNDGVGPWRTTFFSNLVLFALSVPYWFFGTPVDSWELLWAPAAIGFMFFLGQVFLCVAIHKGDVSVLTPLLGTKTVIVALVVSFAFGENLGILTWVAAIMSTVAILVMRGGSVSERKRLLPSIYLSLLCVFFYALHDVLLQEYGAQLGFPKVVAVAYSFVMAYSLFLIPLFSSPVRTISGHAWAWLLAGCVLFAVQAQGLAYVFSEYGKAAHANVLYSSRGIWGIALVWFVGHWFSNTERSQGAGAMAKRLIGAALLIIAIILVLVD